MYYHSSHMSATDCVGLLKLFAENQLDIWVDGGWAVDALLGRQTRAHADLDIAIRHRDVPKLRQILEQRGYSNVPRDDSRPCNFVLGDISGRQVDVHSFTLDRLGHSIFGVPYERKHFGGKGTISGHPVKCVNPKTLVEFHTGYPLDENDQRDVLALCRHFRINLPEEHRDWAPRQRLLEHVRQLAIPKDRPLVVAISGFGGSGKTTLASLLQTQLRDAAVVTIDSFSNHEWRRNADWDNFDRTRFAREILVPAHKNVFPLRYAHVPWPGHVEIPQVEVPRPAVLIVEGCSLFHPGLLPYYDLKIWVDCPLEVATKRGMWRDRHVHKNEQDYYWQNIWMPNERDFSVKYRPDQIADWTIQTSALFVQ